MCSMCIDLVSGLNCVYFGIRWGYVCMYLVGRCVYSVKTNFLSEDNKIINLNSLKQYCLQTVD